MREREITYIPVEVTSIETCKINKGNHSSCNTDLPHTMLDVGERKKFNYLGFMV